MVLEHFSALSTLTYCAKAAHESTPRAAERFLLKIYQGCLIEANIPWGGDPIPDCRSSSTLKNNPTPRGHPLASSTSLMTTGVTSRRVMEFHCKQVLVNRQLNQPVPFSPFRGRPKRSATRRPLRRRRHPRHRLRSPRL